MTGPAMALRFGPTLYTRYKGDCYDNRRWFANFTNLIDYVTPHPLDIKGPVKISYFFYWTRIGWTIEFFLNPVFVCIFLSKMF